MMKSVFELVLCVAIGNQVQRLQCDDARVWVRFVEEN
jgi:hypothetical protein